MSNPSPLETLLSFVFNKVQPKQFLTLGDQAKYVLCVPPPIYGFGVDPFPIMNLKKLPENQIVYPVTSDYFFHSPYMIRDLHPDIVFISGFYRFEQVLRDVIFAEKLCQNKSVIMVANTYPQEETDIDRCDISTAKHRTGDIFKIISIFKKYRSDIKISTITDVDQGITIFENLDEANHVLQHELVPAVESVINYGFKDRDTSTDMTLKEYMNEKS